MFSPFPDSKLSGLDYGDIEHLKAAGVAEGLFIEYKSTFPPENRKVANSIASFANSYGGWYIVGIEADKITNAPTKLTGVSGHMDPLAKVREIVIENVDPVPRFFTELITGPGGEQFVVVCIPDGQDKPCISKEGRIYRRAGDSTVPVAENNRSAIDRIVDEGKHRRNKFLEYCKDDRNYTNGEAGPQLHIYIKPYPDAADVTLPWSREEIKNLLARVSEPVELRLGEGNLSSQIPFDSAQTVSAGLILRQANHRDLTLNKLSIEFSATGWCKFRIPLSQYVNNDWHGYGKISSQEVKDTMGQLREQGLDHGSLIDVAPIFTLIGAMAGIYLRWLGKLPNGFGFEYRIHADNVWRLVPFYDSKLWTEFIEECGVPILNVQEISVPVTSDGIRLWSSDLGVPFWQWLGVETLTGLGLPYDEALCALYKSLGILDDD